MNVESAGGGHADAGSAQELRTTAARYAGDL
jgi:hypothetical protein